MGDLADLSFNPSRAATATPGWWARDLTLSPALVLAVIGLIAAALRVTLLGQHSLWFDEAYVYRVTQASWPGLFAQLRAQDAHPPLYYVLMKLWVRVAGDSEVAMRAPSVCFSVATVGLTYALARRVTSDRVALLAALIVAVSPIEIMSGQEARMYPLLGMLALLSTLLLFESVERGGIPRWTGYAITASAMAYTHYLGVVVLCGHGLWVIGFERRNLARWALAAVAVLISFLPWVPSFWTQAVNGHGWAWYRPPVGATAIGDLLGLYAFGGSSFGFGNYFGLGSLSLVEQLALLLPFLTVLYWGGMALLAHRRAAVLVGLPLILPIAALFVFSLFKPMFYPRWFSFLAPFYAIVLAAGIFTLAERFRGRLDRIVAFMIVGLLLYSVPSLSRYYLDPNYWPYDWRGAAEFVRAHAKAGDFLLYNGPSAEYSFTYYFRDPHPSLTLQPVEALSEPHPHATFNPAWVRRLSKQYPRMWVIITVPLTPAMQARLRQDLDAAYHPVAGHDFGYVSVRLMEARSFQAPGK
jgi:uncharacterized membrane protein